MYNKDAKKLQISFFKPRFLHISYLVLYNFDIVNFYKSDLDNQAMILVNNVTSTFF